MFITRRNPLFLMAADEPQGGDPAPEGTPGTPSEPSTPETPEVDWQKRYTDLHPEYTRATQEASQLRQRDELYRTMLTSDDADERREAAEALGFEFEDEPDPDESYVDPDIARIKREHEEIKAWREEELAARQQQAVFDRDVAHVGNALKSAFGDSLNEKQVQFLGDAAWQRRDPETGLPDIDSVIEDYKSFLGDQQTRPRPRPPHVAANGQEGTQVAQLDTRVKRAEFIAQQVAALDED